MPDWPAIIQMCRPRGVGVKGCPFDGLGCVYKECRRNSNAKDLAGFGCVKFKNRLKTAAHDEQIAGQK